MATVDDARSSIVMREQGTWRPAASRPAITIVIPAWNEERVLGLCLEAVTSQSLPLPYEVLVVDNCSDDATALIAASFSCRLIHVSTAGQLLAKRAGVLAARSDLVVILDADCVAPPGWLLHIYQALREAPQVAAVTCCYRFAGLPAWARLYVFLVQTVLVGFYRVFFRSMPFILGGNVAFRRESCLGGEGYPVSGGIAQTELGLARLLHRSGRIHYLPGMEVESSPRRFLEGPWSFLFRYKVQDYFLPYVRSRAGAKRFLPASRTLADDTGRSGT
ncbi:MAG TPA: glycosyltransferase family A protein [Acidobacteriaceae bacterium]